MSDIGSGQFSLFTPKAEKPAHCNGGAKLKTSSNKAVVKARSSAPASQRRLLKIDEVCATVGLSRATVYRLLKSPAAPFPKPVKVGAGSFWIEEEVIAWLDRLIETRQATIDG